MIANSTVANKSATNAPRISPGLADLLIRTEQARARATRLTALLGEASAAKRAADSHIPHAEMTMGTNYQNEPIIFRTDDRIAIVTAHAVAHRPLDDMDYSQRCRDFCAAYLRRVQQVQALPEAKRLAEIEDEQETAVAAWNEAQCAVAAFPSRNAIDFATVVSFALEHDLITVPECRSVIAESAQAIANGEGR